MLGRTLSHYRITAVLGSGGMGTVYRARDLLLGREVALKVLPFEYSSNPQRRARFEREARAVATLNHPNIVVLHSIEEAPLDGSSEIVRFLTMELVEGRTLAKIIPRGGLALDAFLELAIALTDALSAAHERGIVHRDLKPTNVMVGHEGRIKVLDFGLACLRSQASGSNAEDATRALPSSEEGAVEDASLTVRGEIVGTPAYMSPEQFSGSSVDQRSDIFSLGALLYEMATGERAFRGNAQTPVHHAILAEDPRSVTELKPGLPRQLGRIIKLALAKDPERRFQSVKDLHIQLVELQEEVRSGHGLPEFRVMTSGRSRRLRFATLGLACALVGAIAYSVATRPEPAPPRILAYTQISESEILFPPWPSPVPLVTDGSRIYFTEWIGAGVLRQLSVTGGQPVPFAPQLETTYGNFVWDVTPDRSHVAVGVYHAPAPESALWLVPVVGGSPRRFGDLIGHSVAWTPDGTRVLYANGNALHVASGDGTQPQELLSAPGRVYWPKLSPDGTRVRFTIVDPAHGCHRLWEAEASGANPHPLLPDWPAGREQNCGSWTLDGQYFIFEGVRDHESQLWVLREDGSRSGPPRSQPTQLTNGPLQYIRPLPSSDGRTIYAIGSYMRGETARLDARTGQLVPFLSSLSGEWVEFDRKAQWVSYVTYPKGELWRVRTDGTSRDQLTFSPLRVGPSAWSPDGTTIALVGRTPGQRERIYLIAASGGSLRALTTASDFERCPSWSPDGQRLAFLSNEPGIQIRDIAAEMTHVLPTPMPVIALAWSPDGKYLAACAGGDRGVLLYEFDRQQWRELSEVTGGSVHWSADSQFIDVVEPWREAVRTIRRLRVRDGQIDRETDLQNVRQPWGLFGAWLGVTPEGEPLLLRDFTVQHIFALTWQP